MIVKDNHYRKLQYCKNRTLTGNDYRRVENMDNSKMKKRNIKSPAILVLTALIWGFAFVAQSVGMDYVGPFTFNCVRSILGGMVLIPVILVMDRIGQKKGIEGSGQKTDKDRATLIKGGVCCGVVLMAASSLQQIGIMTTSVGKAGFLTALYIVLVPVLGLLIGKRCSWRLWISVAMALAGFYLLCIKDGFSIEKGDICLLLSALLFSVHIIVIDYFSPKTDGVKMSCIQFFVCGLVCGVFMLIFEDFNIASVMAAGIPILYAGVLSCGVAYTLQIIGQKNYNITIASLILSLESVFSVLGGWLVLHQTLSIREGIGCVVIFVAVILAQL